MAFAYGVDYYPEHWPEERWPLDARMQREAGFNTVRLAEFAWSRLEPSAGHFDFDWLDRAIDVLAAEGMQVVLGTPTAAPPAWLIDEDRTILPVDATGHRVSFGGRRHYCPTHPAFHAATQRIATAMAEHYARHPAVVGWQIDNEFGGNGTARCYCDSCRNAFLQWLQRRYGSVDALNQAWGTVFWSQEYSAWHQVPLPLPPSGIHNPSLELAYRRFASDAFVAYQQLQIDLLRRLAPNQWITTNLMRAFTPLDYAALAQPLDFVSWDNYPRSRRVPGVHPDQVAFTHDLMRGLRGGQGFWIMEEQSGACGWEIVKSTPRPGEIRLWTYQAVGHGADGIVYFRWRTCRFGAEEYWHGILDHDGRPNRRYAEVGQTGAELARLAPLLEGTCVQADVALLRAYDVLWALEIQPHHPELTYDAIQQAWFNGFYQRGIQTNIVSPSADLSRYRVVVAPALFLADTQSAARLEAFVDAGGTLVLTFRSGVKDPENVVVDQTLPGPFARVCGVEVAEYDCAEVGEVRHVDLQLDGSSVSCEARWWLEVLRPTGAQVLGRHATDYLAGQPAVTEHDFGRGRALYVGVHLDGEGIAALVEHLARRAGLSSRPRQDCPGIEISTRRSDERELVFLLNHADQPRCVSIGDGGEDALTGERMEGEVILPPRDLRILVRRARQPLAGSAYVD